MLKASALHPGQEQFEDYQSQAVRRRMIPLDPSDLIWFFDGQDARLVPIGEIFPGQTSLKKSRHLGPLHLTSLGDYSHDGVPLTRLDLALLFAKGLPHGLLLYFIRNLAVGQDFINRVIFLLRHCGGGK